MTNLKVSKYSYMFIGKNEEYLIYNSETNSFIEISERLFNELKKAKLNSLNPNFDEETKEILFKAKILINKEEENSYYYNQKFKSYLSSFSQNTLSLTLVPTTGCNFDCPYCFEKEKEMKLMSDKIINDLINFINEHKQAKNINLTWFGGEPLIAINKIGEILTKIEQETQCKINQHDIITNGYSFNSQAIQLFKKYPLNFIQITLDGNEGIHNQKRKSKKSNKGTYAQILENIENLLKEFPDTTIAIRVNIDKKDCHLFAEIYKELHTRFCSNNLTIYPGFLRYDNEDNTSLTCASLQGKEIRDFYFDLNAKGIDIHFFPKHVEKGCTANSINSYIIGPEREIYKCWNDVGNKKKIVGYINNTNFSNLNLLSKYIVGTTCFEDDKCKNCFFLPICSGGCAWYRYKNLYEKGKYDLCTTLSKEETLNKCLYKHYQAKKTL